MFTAALFTTARTWMSPAGLAPPSPGLPGALPAGRHWGLGLSRRWQMAGRLPTARSPQPCSGSPFHAALPAPATIPSRLTGKGPFGARRPLPSRRKRGGLCRPSLGQDPWSLLGLWGRRASKSCPLTHGIGATSQLRNVSTIRSQTQKCHCSSFPPNLGCWLKKEPGCVGAVPWWIKPEFRGPCRGYGICLLVTWIGCECAGARLALMERGSPHRPWAPSRAPLTSATCLPRVRVSRCEAWSLGAQGPVPERGQSEDSSGRHCPPPASRWAVREGHVCGEHRVFMARRGTMGRSLLSQDRPGQGPRGAGSGGRQTGGEGGGGLPRAFFCSGRLEGDEIGRASCRERVSSPV